MGKYCLGWGGGVNEFQVIIGVHRLSSPGGGGGTLIFSAYVGSDPASTVHPKKYQEFQAPQINI